MALDDRGKSAADGLFYWGSTAVLLKEDGVIIPKRWLSESAFMVANRHVYGKATPWFVKSKE